MKEVMSNVAGSTQDPHNAGRKPYDKPLLQRLGHMADGLKQMKPSGSDGAGGIPGSQP